MQELDWGNVTPEAYDSVNNEAAHVLNVHFVGESSRNRVVKFAIARILHFNKHLPAGSRQRVVFDLRGQRVSQKNLDWARQTIVQQAEQQGIIVSIDFLTN